MTRDEIIRMAREWLPKAYRDGDVGDESKFTRHNMEVAFAAGAAAEREALVALIEAYKVPVGNSAAGEMAAEWTMDALRDLRDAVLERGKK